jgi:hypothetical protein
MPSHVLLRVAYWSSRDRLTRPRAGRKACPPDPGRVPEESYRDYLFRKAIWSSAA